MPLSVIGLVGVRPVCLNQTSALLQWPIAHTAATVASPKEIRNDDST
jgi:hypothetical protein